MPKHYESVQAINEVQDIFGGTSNETVLVKGDLTDPAVAKAIYGLSLEKLVEAGFEEGDILKIETYLDFLEIAARDDENGGCGNRYRSEHHERRHACAAPGILPEP